jgi:hypothetical protein
VSPTRVTLVDEPESAGRDTSNLVGSLAARLAALHLISGADAVGSLLAGYCALGREVSRSGDGLRLRRALEEGRCGTTGDLIWLRMRIGDWVSSLPASPVLDQLRNDVSLLVADDVSEALDSLPYPPELARDAGPDGERDAFVDFLVGFYAFSLEVVRAVDDLAAPTLEPPGAFEPGEEPVENAAGTLLR